MLELLMRRMNFLALPSKRGQILRTSIVAFLLPCHSYGCSKVPSTGPLLYLIIYNGLANRKRTGNYHLAAFNLRNPAAVLFPFVWLRKTTVAWHEVVCEDGDEPFPRAVDNAAADYACGVAPKPHAHGWLITECHLWEFRRQLWGVPSVFGFPYSVYSLIAGWAWKR